MNENNLEKKKVSQKQFLIDHMRNHLREYQRCYKYGKSLTNPSFPLATSNWPTITWPQKSQILPYFPTSSLFLIMLSSNHSVFNLWILGKLFCKIAQLNFKKLLMNFLFQLRNTENWKLCHPMQQEKRCKMQIDNFSWIHQRTNVTGKTTNPKYGEREWPRGETVPVITNRRQTLPDSTQASHKIQLSV